MDRWDALQAYDLVNDGGGNYGFNRGTARNDGKMSEGVKGLFALFSLEREAKRLAKQEALDKPE